MFSRYSLRMLVFSYFLLVGVTWVSGEAGQGLAGRLTSADVLGVVIMIVAFFQVLFVKQGFFLFPQAFRFYLIYLVLYFISVFLSVSPLRGLFEGVVHVYIFMVSIALLNLFRNSGNTLNVEFLMLSILTSGAVLATIGLLQFLFFPAMFSGAFGGLSGTFRNTGQAGSFFSLYLAIVIPGFLVGFIRPRLVNYVMVFLIFLALVLTFKRAAWVGFLIGLLGLLAIMASSKSVRDKKLVAYFVIFMTLFAPLVVSVWGYALNNVDGVSWRLNKKVNSDTATTFVDGFFAENLDATIDAVSDRPFLGVGPANISGVYTEKYEIHSTYMKVLATTGLIGSVFYLVFLFGFGLNVFRSRGHDNVYSRYLLYFFPFFIGLSVSWSYTYHLRKREFWILFAIVCFMIYLNKLFNRPLLPHRA